MIKYQYSLLFVLTTALSSILISATSSLASPALDLFLSTLIATLYFHLINYNKIISLYKKTFQYPASWIGSSVLVGITWLCTFYGTSIMGAFPFIFIYFIVAAIMGLAVLVMSDKDMSIWQVVSGICLFGTIILFVFSQLPVTHIYQYWAGITFAITAGVAAYFYRKVIFIFTSNTQMTTSQVLALRSYFTLIISACLIKSTDFTVLDSRVFLHILGISFFILIFPLYCNQKGIMKAGPEVHSIIAGSCPFITCILQMILIHDIKVSFLIYSFAGSLFLVLPSIIPLLKKVKT